MVQTSLSAWLKKQRPGKNDVPLLQHEGAQTEPPQPGPAPQHSQLVETPHIQHKELLVESHGDSRSFAKHSNLPPNATLSSITADTLPSFRRMTAVLLPVPYPDKFYNDILSDEVAASISMVALWTDSTRSTAQEAPSNDRVVSGIRCRLLATSPGSTKNVPSLYISTITTLAPFRGHGLARALLKRVTARAIREYGIETVTAHMWEANEEARQWYEKQGFKEVDYDKVYYRKLKPSGAYVLEKKIGPQDLIGVDEDS